MFNSSVLDIGIGLVLVYLLISVLLTSISEAIEAVLKTRASDLEKALGELFQGDPAMLRSFYQHPLISGLYLGGYRGPRTTDASAAAGKAAAPARKRSDHRNLPSYIPRETFSAVVMDLLESKGGQRLKQAVGALAARHGVDPAATRRAVEGWYDAAMDRASGWFKRRTQLRLFIMGLAIALIGNVNSVTIAQYLAVNQEARDGLVQLVPGTLASMPAADRTVPAQAGGGGNAVAADGNAVADNASATSEAAATNAAQASGNEQASGNAQASSSDAAQRNAWLRAQNSRLQAIGLPIGWSDPVVALMGRSFPASEPHSVSYIPRWILVLIILIAGYLATAFAVMLGSPFWFDILNKLMIVRSTVKPREKSPDEPPVDGPAPAPAPPAPAEHARGGRTAS